MKELRLDNYDIVSLSMLSHKQLKEIMFRKLKDKGFDLSKPIKRYRDTATGDEVYTQEVDDENTNS